MLLREGRPLWAPVLTVPLSSQASHKRSVRANKLTHLLVGSVGGTCSTVFIATICSDEHARQRTHKTLEIAARAANVRGQPVVRQCSTQLRQGQAQVGGGVVWGMGCHRDEAVDVAVGEEREAEGTTMTLGCLTTCDSTAICSLDECLSCQLSPHPRS